MSVVVQLMPTQQETPAGSANADGALHGDLMERIVRLQDRSAFAELFAHFAPRIKSVMMKGGVDASFADDLAQEAMLMVWRKAALYSPERGAVSTWIFTIVRNLRIDRLRKQSSQAHQDVDGLELPSGDMDGEELTQQGQVVAHVSAAIASLPDDQRCVIELSYVHAMAHGKIAEQLGIPVGTVKSRLRLAYEKLRVELEPVR